MNKQEFALSKHDKGYNCSQAVACAFCEEVGVDETTMFKAAEGFGFGMGNTEYVCGAVSGAILLAGFKNSTANLDGEKSKTSTYALATEITEAFLQKNHSVICKELRGSESGTALRSCPGCMEDAVTIVQSILAFD